VEFYELLRQRDVELGPPLRRLSYLWLGAGEAVGLVQESESAAPDRVLAGLAEACLQSLSAAADPLLGKEHFSGGSAYVPVAMHRVIIGTGSRRAGWTCARVVEQHHGGFAGDVCLVDAEGVIILELRGVRYQRASRAAFQRIGSLQAAPAPVARSAFAQQLLTSTPREREKLLADHLRKEVARVLGVDAASPLQPTQPLAEAGLDSLMAIELRNSLSSSLGRTLPATLLFDYPSLAALHRFILDEPVAEIRTIRSPVTDTEPDAELAQLSQSEIETRLDQKLADLDEWLSRR
jgi:acyl carrier protein